MHIYIYVFCICKGSHCGNTYADTDCRDNNTEHLLKTPLLFNLYHDPGEKYPLNISNAYYAQKLKEVNDTIMPHLQTQGLWAPSQIEDQNQYYSPCCNWGCKDWPQCCDCNQNLTLQQLLQISQTSFL